MQNKIIFIKQFIENIDQIKIFLYSDLYIVGGFLRDYFLFDKISNDIDLSIRLDNNFIKTSNGFIYKNTILFNQPFYNYKFEVNNLTFNITLFRKETFNFEKKKNNY